MAAFGQILGGDGHGRFVRVRADRLEQTCTALRVIEQMAVAVVDCCRLHKLRLEAHELAHRVGDAEHRDQTLQGVVVGDDVFQIALAGLHRVDDIHEIAQCHIGVAGVGQRAQQFGASLIGNVVRLELVEQGAGLVEVLQTCPDEVHGAGFEHRRFHKIPLYTLMPSEWGMSREGVIGRR